jgi:eukaryotic-like serine/threonine-protein kinase
VTKVPDPERWTVLSPQLDDLLDLPEDARAARLTSLRLQDAALADELAALLAGAQSAHGARFLKQTLRHGALHEAPSLAGMRLGAYTLEAPLGQGGTGTVWRARRDDGRFEGEVAIKLLHLSLLGQAGAERFSREGNILARLNHPHIARLLDAGLTDGGQPYLVLELVRGERLDKHCASQALSVEQRLALFDDALAAVAHAHSHLVIHRDIKPSNIMVTPEGVVKLLDFGIAKLMADEAALVDATDLTREWGRALTPEYAAPEQLRGEAVTTATDVYALGVLLYELLTGQLPGPAMKRRTSGALAPTADAPLIRPSHLVLDAQLRRRLSGDLDTITLREMKSEIAERYPTVSAMRDDLARHRSGHPVLARADSLTYRLRKFVGRHRAGCAVAGGVALALLGGAYAQVAVLLALAVGTLMALWQARLAREQTALALVAQKRAEEVKQFIASIFTEATPREGMGGTVTALDLLTSAMARIEAELSASPGVAGELGVLIARSCSQLGNCQLGARALETALPRCETFYGPRHPLTLQGRMLLLEAHNEASRYDDAERIVAPLVEDLRALLPEQADLLIQALRANSYVMAKRDNEPASFAPLHEAIAVGEAHLGPTHAQTLETMGLLSNTYKHFGRLKQALEAAEPALQRARSAFGAQRPHTLLTQIERWYADALTGVGKPAQAEVIARQVVLDQRALDGEVTARVVNAMTAHCIPLLGQGRVA